MANSFASRPGDGQAQVFPESDGLPRPLRVRASNEEAVRAVGEEGVRHAIACECGWSRCRGRLVVSTTTYDDVRRIPTRFLVVRGHWTGEGDRLVACGERFDVVEQTGPAARLAIVTDPRKRRTGPASGRASPPASRAPAATFADAPSGKS